MPVLRTSASDVTTFRRVNATNQPVPDSNIRSSAYTAPLRNIIPAVARASVAAQGASPGNSVLGPPIVPPPPSPPPVIGPFGGSLFFDRYYDPSSNIVASWIKVDQYNPPTSLSPGTGDFTIEWWQYLSSSSPDYPRLFCLGDDALEVSIEHPHDGTRDFYVWINGHNYGPYIFAIQNVWAHFAIVRKNGVVTTYRDGVSLGSFSNTDSIESNGSLVIGARSNSPNDDEVFEGYITNFSWVVGYGLYTSNFTPPMGNIGVVPGQRLLLRANSSETYLDNSAPAGIVFVNQGHAPQWDSSHPS